MPNERRAILAAALLTACDNTQALIHPGGQAAERIAGLWWVMLAIATAVFLLVLLVLARALTHRGRRAEPHRAGDDRGATRWIVAGGVALPAVTLVPLLLFTLHTLGALTPPAAGSTMQVEVTGLQWWWDVRYIGADGRELLRTANELHLPVGRPVRVSLRSRDVIHSFWAPGLQGKMDLVPGRETVTWLQADRPGVYRGTCAEYCGLQHARMAFEVVARPPEEFGRWMESERRAAPEPADSLARRGREVFLSSGCALCHTVRGTPASGTAGPDLTHLASRRTIAAGTLPNTPGHLAGWVGNPQALKPGARMPRVPLAPEELHAVLRYLQTLR